MRMRRRLSVVLLTAFWLSYGGALAQQANSESTQQETSQQAQAQQDLFPSEQIEQLVAPIALYPDALLAQILMAATYPLDIVQAARWQSDYKDLQGEALEAAAMKESWDPSVKSLVFFPDVLAYMNDNLDWTQDLGDAVLAQQDDVMGAVQNLRRQAHEAGNLQTTEQHRVESAEETIVIQPADPEVVYVPTYNPSNVYGQTEPPATTYYPTTYTTPVYSTPPATTVAPDSGPSTTESLLTFGVGALAGGLLTAAINWDDDDDRIYYGGPGYYGRPGYWNSPNYWDGDWRRPENIKLDRNIDRDINIERGDININRERGDINVNRGIVGNDIKKWQHNPERRGGVRYRNKETQRKYSNVTKERYLDRDAARGRDPNRQKLANRQRSQDREIQLPSAKRPETREAKRPAAKRPQSRDVKRPPSRKANVRPPQRSTQRAAAPKRTAQRAAAPKRHSSTQRRAGQASAFNVKKGGSSRAASKRGAKSRGAAGRAKHRGGAGRKRRG